MASKLLVNELQAATGTDITITAGHSLVAAASVFKIAGGIAGQALITDGAGNISFGTVSSLPTQSGQAGKFLKTDGTDASWGTVATDPTMGGDLTGTASNAQIAAGAVGSSEIAADAVGSSEIAADAVGSSEIATGAVGATEIASTIDLSSKTVTLPAASVTDHVTQTDTTGLENDIAILGFKVAANGSLSKYNLVDQTIDVFEDGAGINTSSSTNQFLTDKYVVGSSAHDGTGGAITYVGADTIHQFNSSGTFSNATGTTSIEYLVIAGGGSGGSGYGGGGGAGGYRTGTGFTVVAEQDYTITVGAGGVAESYAAPTYAGTNGEDSIFSTITSTGGGRGGAPGNKTGATGGSGGGGSDANAGGAGNTPSTSPAQGTGGGSGPGNYGGGGGGATTGGTSGSGGPGVGGGGTASSITGSATTRAGGGGGGSASGSVNGAIGGAGGGGAGGKGTSDTLPGPTGSRGVAGTANTGSGGGGGGYDMGGDGGAGVVILKYATVSKVVADLTLVSNATTAEAVPTKGDLVMTYTNGAGTASIGDGTNGDIRAFVSRDAGTTYTQATLASQGTTGGHTILTAHDLDISAQPSGTSMLYKITTHNQSASKETRIQAVSLGWS